MSKTKIALFAFRKRHKHFFDSLSEDCPYTKVLFSQRSFKMSLKGIVQVSKADFRKACFFAVEEFGVKSVIKVPKVLLSIYFSFMARVHFLRYYALLDNAYTKVLIWNGGKFRERIAIEVATIQNIKIYYFENGLLPNTMVFDSQGINYENSVPRKRIFFENYKSTITLPQNLVPRIGKDRDSFKGAKNLLPTEYIFVPFQVDADTQILMQSPWIKNMRMLFDVIEKLSKDTKYHFVLKEHPSSGVKYSDLHQRTKNIPQINFHNSHSTQHLIEKSLAVITINSTVGIESLLFHKKVIVLGDAFYAIEGISYAISDFEALLKIVIRIKKEKIHKNIVDNFLKYLYNDYLIQKDTTYKDEMCKRILAKNLEDNINAK